MNAEIISVGTELLLGSITDTNATYLTRELAALGINCYWVSQVGDNPARLQEVLARALDRSDLTVVSGGLGPTEDDLTREALAAVLGETPSVQPELEAELRAFFAKRGVAMPPGNVKQATLIPSASILPNPVGTAPGWWVEHAGHILVCMPGVPHEMMRMWSREIAPRLAARSGASLVSRTLKILGMGESAAEEEVRDLLHTGNPTVGTYAKNDGIHFRLTARAPTEAEARALLAPLEAAVRERFGEAIWGADDDTLEDVICDMLAARGLGLAVVETGGASGGQIARTLSGARQAVQVVAALTVPGTDGGALAAAGLDTGFDADADMISEVGVRALAEAAHARWGTDAALVAAGSLPAGRDDERVESVLWVAILFADAGGPEQVRLIPIRAARGEIRRLSALAALNLLRKELGSSA
ncbi:MAG: CinA family nicotinamide mononucleotide deamidase-related protein [Chloroflexia bacterium]